MSREVSHYVVTAHPPGGVLHTVKCNFLAPDSEDVVVGKSRRLEVRQLQSSISSGTTTSIEGGSVSPFPIVFSCPINGRITSLQPLSLPQQLSTSLLFVTTDQYQYALIGYNPTTTAATAAAAAAAAAPSSSHYHSIKTYASGDLKDDWNFMGTLSECGPLVAVDPHSRCIVLHLYDGLVTIFPINLHHGSNNNLLGPVFHAPLEERTILSLTMLHHLDPTTTPPHLCLLHQDARGTQHVSTHVVDLEKSQLLNQTNFAAMQQSYGGRKQQPFCCEWLKKSRIDGGSGVLMPVPPRKASASAASAATTSNNNNPATLVPSGGVVILGQRQITFCALNHYKVMPIPPAMLLSWDILPPDVSGMPRFLIGDEFGNLHMLTLITSSSMMTQQPSPAATTTTPPQVDKVIALQLDTLGSCGTLATSLQYLDHGLVFCGSTLGDSQLVQIHDEPIPVEEQDDAAVSPMMYGNPDDVELGDTTYLSVVEEYTHLGPIVDFDLVPMASEQSQVVTASGTSKSGSLRVIRNGIGMKEYASVELPGIQNMWSLRRSFDDDRDTYLVQSFVGETRVLGVVTYEEDGDAVMKDDDGDADEGGGDEGEKEEMAEEEEEEVGGTLEEVVLPGLESNASTLYVTNVVGNLFLQITEDEVKLASAEGEILDTHSPEHPMTVATANEAGQIVVALRGGKVVFLEIADQQLLVKGSKQMTAEVSCLDVHPFSGETVPSKAELATLVAVGLWDDFTVRLLSLEGGAEMLLEEKLQIHLSTTTDDEDEQEGQRGRNNRNNMMARSLCLITLDFSSSTSNSNNSNTQAATPGVNMLFVGLGDGTLVSFAVVQEYGTVQVQSKKEVSLGTQRINLIPLHNEKGGMCVLATGDRPTVIYLAGAATSKNYNPKLCYSNVNLSPASSEDGENNDVSRPHAHQSIAVNVAAPFFSPLLLDNHEQEQYSLCVADDAHLRMGVIDDIQKLHVTTCRLGMAPRRIVHCPEGRLFAVGCIESGIKHLGMDGGEMAMGNCLRFLDDTTFDDIKRIDMEPCEMILSIVSVKLKVVKPMGAAAGSDGAAADAMQDGESSNSSEEYESYLVVGTCYAMHDEDEPTNGRVLVLSCSPEGDDPSRRSIRTITQMQVRGGVYSMCQFFEGKLLVTINSKTQLCQLVREEGTGVVKLAMVGVGHHGHILSLFVTSRANKALPSPPEMTANAAVSSTNDEESNVPGTPDKEMLAIVGDLMRSISLVQYYPQHETLEEVARDFNSNWTTSIAMLNENVYLGAENWNNLFVLRRNTKAQSEEVRCRLDTIGEFHLGEMCNKFMSGSLVMPSNFHIGGGSNSESPSGTTRQRSLASPKKASTGDSSKGLPSSPGGTPAAVRSKRPIVAIGSQTLFGTVDGTLGVILGLDGPTTAFFSCLERSMQKVIAPVGNFSHHQFRAFNAEQRLHPSHGFCDGDLVESFLDLEKNTMEAVVQQMNYDGGWEIKDSTFAAGSNERDEDGNVGMGDEQRPELSVDDVLAVVEEMTMLH